MVHAEFASDRYLVIMHAETVQSTYLHGYNAVHDNSAPAYIVRLISHDDNIPA